ncbi:hypothetical protein NQ317_002742 [Molorchus minor]|uniref:DUF1308 domain-containing protein n=1 Tax=Molorchus minor TaxID=1323400 RepID=A0ABQ9K4G9_9CUCU|nr:hypothetical protein NQ317_002742 [Molorchus minor]
MNDAEETQSLMDIAATKIASGENLLKSLEEFECIEGSCKLRRKINQEIKFLKNVHKKRLLKKEYLQCSNLTHFCAVVNTLKSTHTCVSVNKVFMLGDRKITVDIVSDGGLTWTKVIARNPISLSQICLGNASYGVRSIIDQAEEFMQCAKLYPCLFQTPKIIFIFANGISNTIATKLEHCGIIVQGTKLSELDNYLQEVSDEEDTAGSPNTQGYAALSTKNLEIKNINLDVSAMLAYCSSVTNGSAVLYDFEVGVLKQQAEWERLRPQKPILDRFFLDKKLYCCQTARDNFINIVETVGGPNEKIRAGKLLNEVTVLPDDAKSTNMSEEDESMNKIFDHVQFTKSEPLKLGGKLKQRSLIIFSFGDRIRAVTVTANDGFVRAAKQQGVNFVVFVHESRALTEQKEKAKAIPIQK